MISLDQVELLQKKVEAAVEKITLLTREVSQLKSDNDALRRKCTELTNALSTKSELVSTLEADQTKIEEGILSALSRLDVVENTILTSSGADSIPVNTENSETENTHQENIHSDTENNTVVMNSNTDENSVSNEINNQIDNTDTNINNSDNNTANNNFDIF